MRYVGRIAAWNDAKGYGFVSPNGGDERAFVHIKSFDTHGRRPVEGDLISYKTEFDDRRRLNATRIRYVSAGASHAHPRAWFPRKFTGTLALVLLGGAAHLGRIPVVIPIVYLSLSVIALIAYGLDKSAAKANRWRIQESTLHVIELLGGWPGALIAQAGFHHKTRKLSYQITFWLIVAINLSGLAWLIHSGKIWATLIR